MKINKKIIFTVAIMLNIVILLCGCNFLKNTIVKLEGEVATREYDTEEKRARRRQSAKRLGEFLEEQINNGRWNTWIG